MKHFIYTVKRRPKDHAYGVVTLYRVIRNRPKRVGTYDFHFEDDAQAALNCAAKYKCLPRKYFETKHPNGSSWWGVVNLREKKIASFDQL